MIDRRFPQTQHRFASDDLETMSEAHRYHAHVFGLFRPYIGRRVLEVGAGIGTMSRSLLEVADRVVGIEPNPARETRTPWLDLQLVDQEGHVAQLTADPAVRVARGSVGAPARTSSSNAHWPVARRRRKTSCTAELDSRHSHVISTA